MQMISENRYYIDLHLSYWPLLSVVIHNYRSIQDVKIRFQPNPSEPTPLSSITSS